MDNKVKIIINDDDLKLQRSHDNDVISDKILVSRQNYKTMQAHSKTNNIATHYPTAIFNFVQLSVHINSRFALETGS